MGGGALYLVNSSLRRSPLTSIAPRTSSRICFRSSLSSGKDCGSGSRPLSVRNFNITTERRRVGRETSRRKLTDVKRLERSSNYICEAIFAKQSIARLPVIISACFQETFTVNYHLMERHHVISAAAARGCNIDRFVCTRLHLAACVHTDTHMQRGARTHSRANKLEKKYLSLTLKLEPFSIRSAQTHTSTPSPHVSCSSINLNHMRKSNPPTATKHTQTRVCLVAMNHVTPQLCPLSVKRCSKESHKGWYKWHHTVRAGNENRIS